jgi:hypothetical protein
MVSKPTAILASRGLSIIVIVVGSIEVAGWVVALRLLPSLKPKLPNAASLNAVSHDDCRVTVDDY